MAFALALAKAKGTVGIEGNSSIGGSECVGDSSSRFQAFKEVLVLKSQLDSLRLQEEKLRLGQEWSNLLGSKEVHDSLEGIDSQLNRILDNKDACLATLRSPASTSINANSLVIRRDHQENFVDSFNILVK